MNPHVDLVVQLFVKKEKRERVLALAAKTSRRGDFRSALLHDTRSLDPGVLRPLEGGARGLGSACVLETMRSLGRDASAYCISEVIDADDREMPLVKALGLIVGRSEDSLVYAIGTSIAFYENHEGEQFILHRKK